MLGFREHTEGRPKLLKSGRSRSWRRKKRKKGKLARLGFAGLVNL
jgi:hypothetical protein